MAGMFAYEFMQRALLAGIMAGVLCSFVAFFIVLKRLSFITVGISHSSLGGIALGLFLGLNPVLTGGLFATLTAWGIGYSSRHGDIQEDTSTGIFFSTAMALGIVLLGFTRGVYTDLFSFLFGNILAVTPGDLFSLAILGGLIIILLGLFFKELLLVCFDEEMARAEGLPVGFLYYFLLTCISVTVILAVKIVGIVMAAALLVIPAATAYELVRDFRLMLILSIATGVISTLGGLWFSYRYDLASGATIVLLASLFFTAALLFSPRRSLVHRIRVAVGETLSRYKTRKSKQVLPKNGPYLT